MTPQRNAPCPCGSGKKYKQCCGSPAALAAEIANGREQVRRVAAAAEAWEVDAFPLMISFRDEAAERPVALLVTAGELVVHHDILPSLSGEHEDVAKALEGAIAAAAREVGAQPRGVRVRHAEVADALRRRMEPHRVAVEAAQTLPSVAEAARALLFEVTGDAKWPPVCQTERWSGWGLPRGLVSELFGAAGAFWTAACWRGISNLQAPRARLPSGREWTVSVLGNGGQQFGLALYSDGSDLYERVAGDQDDDYPFARIQGHILALTYDPASDVAREAVTEARLAQWKLASPSAFPSLMTVNTPAGGVTRGQIQDVTCLLRALPAFVQAHEADLEREERTGSPCAPIEWTHAQSGVVLSYAGEAFALPFPWDTREGGEGLGLPPELLGLLDEVLATAIADGTLDLGEGQDPDDLLASLSARTQGPTEAYNATPQPELGGLSPIQVHRLLQGDWSGEHAPVRLRRDVPAEALAASALLSRSRALLEFAVERGSLAATQGGNLKVAVVSELSDRMGLAPSRRRLAPTGGSRVREHDVWPLHEARVLAELAGLLTPMASKFVPTELARTLLDPSRAGELYALLFETVFLRFNLAYGLELKWPELQAQAAYTLYRLGGEAKTWKSSDDLVQEVVLPYALEQGPQPGGLDARPSLLEAMLLDALTDAGLVERESDGAGGRRRQAGEARYRVTPLLERFITFDLDAEVEGQ